MTSPSNVLCEILSCILPGLAAAGTSSLVAGRSYAVDSKHRSTDEMHQYLDSLFCLKDKVALVTGRRSDVAWPAVSQQSLST